MAITDFYWGGGVGKEPSRTGKKISPRQKKIKIEEINKAIEANRKTPFLGKDFSKEVGRTIGLLEPEGQKTKITAGDVIKEVPSASLKVLQDILKIPFRVVASVATAPKTIVTGKAPGVKFNVPGVGEVETYYDEVSKQIESGADPLAAALMTGSQSILDVAVVAGLAQGVQSKFNRPRTTTITEGPSVTGGIDKSSARNILGVKSGDSNAAVRQAYIRLAQKFHPDKGGNTEAMAKINQAYAALTGEKVATVRVSDVQNYVKPKPQEVYRSGAPLKSGVENSFGEATYVTPSKSIAGEFVDVAGGPAQKLFLNASQRQILDLSSRTAFQNFASRALREMVKATGRTNIKQGEAIKWLAQKQGYRVVIGGEEFGTAIYDPKLLSSQAPVTVAQATPPPTQAAPQTQQVPTKTAASIAAAQAQLAQRMQSSPPVPGNLALAEAQVKKMSNGNIRITFNRRPSQKEKEIVTKQYVDRGYTNVNFVNRTIVAVPPVEPPADIRSTIVPSLGRAGFTSIEALRFITQPSRWIYALDDAWFKLVGRYLEKLAFGKGGGQVVPPDPYSSRLLPEKVRNIVQYGARLPTGYVKLLDARQAEQSLMLSRADRIFTQASKLSDSELESVRGILESGNHPGGKLGEFTKAAEQLFYDLGEGLVQIGSLKPAQFAKYARQYFPKFYRIFEDRRGNMFTRLGRRLDLQYAKSRKNLTPEEEQALGIIEGKDVKYPLVRRAVQEIHDLTLGRFFLAISQNPTLASPVPQVGFEQLPKSKKLGALSEMYVEKNIAKDLESLIEVPAQADKFIQGIYGLFKIFKVPLNIPTVGRNALSNIKLADLLGGVPPEDTVTWTRAIAEVKNKGLLYKEMQAMGKISGFEWLPSEMNDLVASFRATKNWQQLSLDLLKRGVSYYSKMEEVGKMAVYIANKDRLGKEAAGAMSEYAIGNYQKVPALIDQLRRGAARGPLGVLGPIVASPFITFRYLFLPRILATATFRRPFTFLKYELAKRYIQILAISYVAGELNRNRDEVEKLFQRAVKYWGGRGKMVIPLPSMEKVTAPDGTTEEQLQLLDVSFIEPYGDIPEFWNRSQSSGFVNAATTAYGLFGNPWMMIPLQLSRNEDFYTGREITQELDSPTTKARKTTEFILNQFLPGTATYVLPDLFRSLTGRANRYGEVQSPTVQILSTLGIRSVPFRMSMVAVDLDKKLNALDKAYSQETNQIIFDRSLTQEEKKAKINEKTEQYEKKLLQIINGARLGGTQKIYEKLGD